MGSRKRLTWGALLLAALFALVLPLATLLDAGRLSASRDERTISLYEIHTGRRITSTFKRDGQYVPEELQKLNVFLRDWRRDLPTKMDPQLFDMVWELQQELGSKSEVHVVSAYRSPVTNETLRRAGGGQAKHSQHTLGKAMDIHLPDISMREVRNSALIHEWGGVGYYPTSAIPFVHIDTARVRAWPRLPRTELAMLFPNGPTKHMPADGRPLNDDDRRRARIAIAQLERRKKADTLLARAEQTTPAPQLLAQAEAAPPAAATAPAKAPTTRIVVASAEAGPQDLGLHSRNLWYYRAGGDSLLQAAFNPSAPAAAAKATAPATRSAAASLPAARPLAAMAPTNAPAPRRAEVQVASLVTPADAGDNHDTQLWVNGSAQRRSFLAAIFAPPANAAVPVPQPAARPKATAVAAKATPQPPAERIAALAAETSLDASRPAVPAGWSYRQEQDVSYAPEYDDDHPDELSYRPFQILPLMTAEPIVSNTRVVAMVERDYHRVVDFLTDMEDVNMQFRPSPAAAEMRWMDQFHGKAIVRLHRRADAEPTPDPAGEAGDLPQLASLAAR
jgi:uncharacterized protein YcbK (DUF882 family)